jgi:hypothetical protein
MDISNADSGSGGDVALDAASFFFPDETKS